MLILILKSMLLLMFTLLFLSYLNERIRFDLAISCYHQALAIQPKLNPVCSDMLSRAMEDCSSFPTIINSTIATAGGVGDGAGRIDGFSGADTGEAPHILPSYFIPSSSSSRSQVRAAAALHISLTDHSGIGIINDVDNNNINNNNNNNNMHSFSLSAADYGYIGGTDVDVDADASYESVDPSRDQSMGSDAAAESFSRIAGRLSLGSTDSRTRP